MTRRPLQIHGRLAAALVLALTVAFVAAGTNDGTHATPKASGALVPQGYALQGSPRVTPGSANDLMTWLHRTPAAPAARSDRPNIVMVMADDMRADDLRFAPHLRSLQSLGLTFDNSFSPYPLCCPARASFLTGQYSHNHHVFDTTAPWGYGAFDDSRTLATSLAAAGYTTGFVGKYLNGYGQMKSLVSGQPSYKYVPNGWTDWAASFSPPAGSKTIHGGTYRYFDSPYNVNGRLDNRYSGRYQTDVISDFSISLVNKYAARSAPFFLDINYVAPHHGSPIESDDPKPYRRSNGQHVTLVTPARPAWVKGHFDRQVTRSPGVPVSGPTEDVAHNKVGDFATAPPLTRAEDAALAEVTRQRAEAIFVMDKQIGRLIAHLKAVGEWDNTIFMFTSDNGYYLGEHHRLQGKVWGHEPSIRVPFLVAGPGLQHGGHRYDPISTVDVAATILDIGGASAPRLADGVSRYPAMLTGDRGWTAPVVYEALLSSIPDVGDTDFKDPRTVIGIRTAQYAYLRYRNGQIELYDLAVDPEEYTNVSDDPAYADVMSELNALWLKVKDCAGASCQDTLPADMVTTPVQTQDLAQVYSRTISRLFGL